MDIASLALDVEASTAKTYVSRQFVTNSPVSKDTPTSAGITPYIATVCLVIPVPSYT